MPSVEIFDISCGTKLYLDKAFSSIPLLLCFKRFYCPRKNWPNIWSNSSGEYLMYLWGFLPRLIRFLKVKNSATVIIKQDESQCDCVYETVDYSEIIQYNEKENRYREFNVHLEIDDWPPYFGICQLITELNRLKIGTRWWCIHNFPTPH